MSDIQLKHMYAVIATLAFIVAMVVSTGLYEMSMALGGMWLVNLILIKQ